MIHITLIAESKYNQNIPAFQILKTISKRTAAVYMPFVKY